MAPGTGHAPEDGEDEDWEDVDDDEYDESDAGASPGDDDNHGKRHAHAGKNGGSGRSVRRDPHGHGTDARYPFTEDIALLMGEAGLAAMADTGRWQLMLRTIKDAYDNITPDRIESLADELLHALEEQGGSVDGFVSFLEGVVGQDEADATRA